jgi:hypothetical protein
MRRAIALAGAQKGTAKTFDWGRELTVGCPVVVSPLPREWSCWYRRGQSGISFLETKEFLDAAVGSLTPGRGSSLACNRSLLSATGVMTRWEDRFCRDNGPRRRSI